MSKPFVSSLKVAATPGPCHVCVIPDDVHNFNVNTRGVVDVFTPVMRLCLERGVQGNGDGITDVDEAISMFFKGGGKVNFKKDFKNKLYTDLDITSLFNIIPKVTQIRSDNPNVKFQELHESLEKIKYDRNQTMHVNKGTHSENKMAEFSEHVEKIIGQLRNCYDIDLDEIQLIKIEFREKMDDIMDPKQAREKQLMNTISLSIIKENHEKWAPELLKFLQFDLLPVIDVKILRNVIFFEADFQILSCDNIAGIVDDCQVGKIIACKDILSSKNYSSVYIIEGDPGSGKSTFLRMMCLDFCKNCCKNSTVSIFTQVSLYDMILLINCRDKMEIRTFWEHFRSNYSAIAQTYHENKWAVISALRETKMIIAIDGLDEANEASTELVRDVIHQFAGFEMVKFLITSRPGFSKNVVEQFNEKRIQCCVLNVNPIENITDQENFIKRVIKHIPEINEVDILKTFGAIRDELNSHFNRPLDLMLFIALFIKFPEKTNELTSVLSLMKLMFEMHLKDMSERMPSGFTDRQHSIEVLKIFCEKCLWLIQNSTYEIDQENFDSLTEECLKVNKHINVERVLSCILLKRKCSQTTLSATRDFYHRSQQEYFASRVLTDRLKKCRSGTLLNKLKELTGEDVHEANMMRLVH